MKLVTIGNCGSCGLELQVPPADVRPSMDVDCACGANSTINPPLSAQKSGPSARKGVKFVGAILYAVIVGALSGAYPAFLKHNYTTSVTIYLSFLITICKIVTAVFAVAFLLAFLYWAYRLSADGTNPLAAFALPVVGFGLTAFPLIAVLKDYSFLYSHIFLYFLLGVTGATLVFTGLIIMYVSTDSVTQRIGRLFAVLPYILFTTLWMTALGQATFFFEMSAAALWLKIIVGICNTIFATLILVIPAGAAFFISD